jgi:hypothetical protein
MLWLSGMKGPRRKSAQWDMAEMSGMTDVIEKDYRAMHLTQAAGNRLSPRNSFRRYWAEIDSFLHQPQEQ